MFKVGAVSLRRTPLALAVALTAAVTALAPGAARAASCCGGGSSEAFLLPRGALAGANLAVEWERYAGFWDGGGTHKPDPAGSAFAQYRLGLSLAARLSERWQVGAALPYVWNDNHYTGASSRSNGLGDGSASLWYEALSERSAWRMNGPGDLVPTVQAGLALTLPTGLSPYDDVADSMDVTGRGFYRVDGKLQVDKSYRAFSASLSFSYGLSPERPVNRHYGRWVDPYRKQLGARTTAGGSLSYRHFIGTGGTALTLVAAASFLHEAAGTIDGERDPTSGMRKTAAGATLVYSGTDDDWSARVGWMHDLGWDRLGRNFPSTDTFTLGVRRVVW